MFAIESKMNTDIIQFVTVNFKKMLCKSGNIQHAMTTYTRSTRKLIRDLIEEQQKTLEFLSNQVLTSPHWTNISKDSEVPLHDIYDI